MPVPAPSKDSIIAWLHARQEDMARLLSELIAIPTENPPGRNYGEWVDLLEGRLREFGLDCERIRDDSTSSEAGECPQALLAVYGSGSRRLYFHGHYDVVPAQSPSQFQPVRNGHFLFGRGSCDMKGGIVAMLFAILALKSLGADLGGQIALLLVPDEETGGLRGSARLAQLGLLGRDAIGMLLAEPTGGVVWNASRGAISMRIRVLGKPAHVGLQHQGENAFERMVRVVGRLQQLKAEVERCCTDFSVGPEHARNSILMLGGESCGGSNFNVVPGSCSFTLDRRVNPEEDLVAEKARLVALLESCREEGIPLEWEIFQEAPSSSSSAADTVAESLSRNIQAVTGEPARFELCPGLLETRFYAARNIPAYACGPGLLSVAHGPNEYIDLRKMAASAAVYACTALDLLEPSRSTA